MRLRRRSADNDAVEQELRESVAAGDYVVEPRRRRAGAHRAGPSRAPSRAAPRSPRDPRSRALPPARTRPRRVSGTPAALEPVRRQVNSSSKSSPPVRARSTPARRGRGHLGHARGERQQGRVELDPDAARPARWRASVASAVAQVDHRRGARGRQRAPRGQSRLGAAVPRHERTRPRGSPARSRGRAGRRPRRRARRSRPARRPAARRRGPRAPPPTPPSRSRRRSRPAPGPRTTSPPAIVVPVAVGQRGHAARPAPSGLVAARGRPSASETYASPGRGAHRREVGQRRGQRLVADVGGRVGVEARSARPRRRCRSR